MNSLNLVTPGTPQPAGNTAHQPAGVILVKFGYQPSQRLDKLIEGQHAELFELDPLTPELASSVHTLHEQAQVWAQRIPLDRARRWSIIAYCTASAFAFALGNALASRGVNAATVVFDAVQLGAPDVGQILSEFAASTGSPDSPPQDLCAMPHAEALKTGLTFLNAVVDPDSELAEPIRHQLVQRRAAWLSFALACVDTVRPGPTAELHALLSEHAEWPQGFPAPAHIHRLPVAPESLLQSAEAASVVADIIRDTLR